MATFKAMVYEANWQAEESKGRGQWCYAAVTRAVRSALLGETLDQEEIAHNFYVKINQWGGPDAAGIGGTRGAAIKKYLAGIRQEPGADPIPFDWVKQWVKDEALGKGVDPKPLLTEAYGSVDLDGLTQSELIELPASDHDAMEVRICQTLDANGLGILGNTNHYMVIHGYELDVEGEDTVVARRFYVWDPANGSSRARPLGDYDGNELTLVTK